MTRAIVLILFALSIVSCAETRTVSKGGPPCPLELIKPGLPALDFCLRDTTGHVVCLNDFRGKLVVLVIGSGSSAHYVSNIENLNRLAKKYLGRGVQFLTLYSAEADPRVSDVNDYRKRFARAARAQYSLQIEVEGKPEKLEARKAGLEDMNTLVDELPMAIAGQYGYQPFEIDNPAFIIDPQGLMLRVYKHFEAEAIDSFLHAYLGMSSPAKVYQVSPAR